MSLTVIRAVTRRRAWPALFAGVLLAVVVSATAAIATPPREATDPAPPAAGAPDPAPPVFGTTDPAPPAALDVSGPCGLPNTGANLSEGPTNWSQFHRPVGTLRAAMIFVDFSDAPAGGESTQVYYDQLKGGAGLFATSSYGRFNLEIVPTHRWFRLSNTSSYWAARFSEYLQAAASAADPSVNFAGMHFLFVVPSRGARAITNSPTMVYGNIRTQEATFRQAVRFGQDLWYWGFKVLNHESGHMLSLPDLYGGTGGHQFVGGWDLMGLISGHAPDYFAWHKWKLGWLDNAQMSCVSTQGTSTHVITPLARTGGTKAVIVKYGSTRAYVAEVRERAGLDARACDTGVVVYRVDSAINSMNGPIRVMDAHPSSSACGHPLNDAAFDLGTGENPVFNDTTARVRIEVRAKAAGGDYTVRVTYGTGPTQPPPTTQPPGDTVFEDTFDTDRGWTINPDGTDTATVGRFERGTPQPTSYNGIAPQPGPRSGAAVVTGAMAGADVGANDLDGGVTTVRSPMVSLPAGTLTLSFDYFLGHLDNATAADYLKISVRTASGTVQVFTRTCQATNQSGQWATVNVDLSAFAGQAVRLEIAAADTSGASLVEAGVDNIRIRRS